jgi:hypothetical protein
VPDDQPQNQHAGGLLNVAQLQARSFDVTGLPVDGANTVSFNGVRATSGDSQENPDAGNRVAVQSPRPRLPNRDYFSKFITVFHHSFGSSARHKYNSLASCG